MSQLVEHFEGATPGGVTGDVEGMRIPTLSAIALATLLATGGVANAQAGGAGSIAPVTDFPLVSVDIAILDAAGTTVKSLSCEWTEPQADDRQCLRFQSDPQVAFAKIEESGGVRADQRPVGGEQRLLDGILGQLETEAPRDVTQQWLLMALHELGERALIAFASALGEPSIVLVVV